MTDKYVYTNILMSKIYISVTDYLYNQWKFRLKFASQTLRKTTTLHIDFCILIKTAKNKATSK